MELRHDDPVAVAAVYTWAYLAAILRHQGVLVDAEELSRLPHHVQLSERLRARLTST